MNNDNGSINFSVGLDNTKLAADAAKSKALLKSIGSEGVAQGAIMENGFKQAINSMTVAAGAYLSINFAARLGQQIIAVRGEFQQLGIAFEVMLGSKDKADKLMQEAIVFAQKTPFTLTDVASNIKQLMAMGVATGDVMSTMKSLGDVAAGVSVPISRVAINYGQVMTLGKLQGRELRDFAMAGIPLMDELAKTLGKSKSEITDMVTASQITAEMVTKAFQSMSGEGGKFYNMMERQNASVTGQISNLTDKWQAMLNDIGKSNEGLIYGGISGLSSMVANYEEIGKTLEGLVIAYGAYKAAIIVTSVAQSFHTAQAAASVFSMTGVLTKLTFAQYASAKAQGVLNAAMSINPYIIAAVAIGALAYGTYKYITYQTELEKATSKMNIELANEKDKADGLFYSLENAKKGTKEYEAVKKQLISSYGEYIPKMDLELDSLGKIKDAQLEVNKALKENIILKTQKTIEADINTEANTNIEESSKNIIEKFEGTKKYLVQQLLADYIEKSKDQGLTSEMGAKARTNIMSQLGLLDDRGNSNSYKAIGVAGDIQKITIAILGQQKATEEARGIMNQYRQDQQAVLNPESEKPNDPNKKEFITAEQERVKLRLQLVQATKELAELETKSFEVGKDKAPLESIKDKQAEIKDLKDKLGIKEADKQAKTAIKTAQEIADAALKVTNANKKTALDQRTAELENQQSLLSIKEDGFVKSQEQLKLNGEKEKLAGAKLAQELIEGQQQLERDKWEQLGSKGVFKPITNSADDLSPENKNRITEAATTFGIVDTAQNAKLIKDLLAQYQDFTAKKTEIDKKYNADLLALQSLPEGEGKNQAIAKLQEDWKNASSKLSLDDFQKNIDWASIFGDLDKVSTDSLNDFRKKVAQYLTSAGGSISKEDLKVVTDAFTKLNEAISDRTPIKELKTGYEEYKIACDAVIEAQKILNDLTKSGNGSVKDLTTANKNLTDSQNNKAASLKKMNSAVNKIGNEGQQLVSAGKDIVDMLENLGVGISDGTKKALDGFGQTMDGLASIDITKPMSLITGGIKTVTGYVNMVAAIFGGGSKELSQGVIDYYDDLMSTMKDVIATHKDLIAEFSGQAAVSEAEKAIELIDKQIEATRNLGKEYLASRAKHSHSIGYNLQNDLKGYSKELNAIGVDFSNSKGGIGQLFTMSPEQLNQIKEEVPEAWAKIDDKTRGYLQTIIDSKGEIEDTTKALGEALAGLSFDSAKDSLKDLLLSTDTTFEDIADNFEDYMRNAIVNTLVNSTLDPMIKTWYANFVDYMSDGVLTDIEAEASRKEYDNIGKTGLSLTDAAFTAAGIPKTPINTPDNSMQGKISAAINEDTATELVGLWNRNNIDIRGILEMSKASSATLLNIAANTLRTADNTDQLAEMKASLKSMDSKMVSSSSRL